MRKMINILNNKKFTNSISLIQAILESTSTKVEIRYTCKKKIEIKCQ